MAVVDVLIDCAAVGDIDSYDGVTPLLMSGASLLNSIRAPTKKATDRLGED